MNIGLDDNLKKTIWIEGLQCRIRYRKSVVKENIKWCNFLESEDIIEVDGRTGMISLITCINYVISIDKHELTNHVESNLIYFDINMSTYLYQYIHS